jgi:uncharacterized membrane protein
MIENLKKNVRNRTWWIALITALIALFKIWGIDLTDYIGKDWQNTIYTICTIGVLLGISIDTTAPTLGQPKEQQQEQEPQQTNTEVETKTEATTTAVNETVTEKSDQAQNISDLKLQQIKSILFDN